MSEFFWGLLIGVLLGAFHVQIWAATKPFFVRLKDAAKEDFAKQWAKFQAWRNAR